MCNLELTKFRFVEMMRMTFEDVLEIKNGRNQRTVENSEGKYPIYGSGGIMGYADDYICDAQTVIVGRKGSINNPLFVEEPFWNVDTAFGLCANRDVLLPRYLYYFCKKFDFERLNKAVTIPSLTKSDLLKIEIDLPHLEEQQIVVDKLVKMEQIIELRKQELYSLDSLIKSRFVELFGDLNDKKWNEEQLGKLCEQLKRYPTFCNMEYLENGVRVIRIGNILLDGHMDEIDDNYVFVYDEVNEDFPDTVIEMNDIVMAVRGDGSAAKRIGIVREEKLIGSNISPNLIRIKADSQKVLPVYLFYYLTSELGQKRLDAYVNKTAKKNIAAKDIAKVLVPVPDIRVQNQFISFVEQTDKLKFEVQKSLDEAQILMDSLMQKYFG